MKPFTATLLSVVGVAASAAVAFAANTHLLDHAGTLRTDTQVVDTSAAAAGTENSDPVIPTPPRRTQPGVVPPAAAATPADPPVQVFELGRLGSVRAVSRDGIISVASVDSAWTTQIIGSGSSVTVTFRNGTERFSFDLASTDAGLSGTLHGVAAPGGTASAPTTPGRTRHEDDDDYDEDAEREYDDVDEYEWEDD